MSYNNYTNLQTIFVELKVVFLKKSGLYPNRYITDLLPHMCAADHLIASFVHAKLIRMHTCATGSESCDYRFVGDESETAKSFADVRMV